MKIPVIGAALGAAAGTGLWWLLTTRTPGTGVALISLTAVLYAMLELALRQPAPAPPVSSVTCAAVLPGVELTTPQPAVAVPGPRVAESVA